MAAGVFFGTGYEEIEALTVVDLLRRANIPVWMISVTDERQVTGSHGITVAMDKTIQEVDAEELEMIILPGGMPGTLNLEACGALTEQIKNFRSRKKPVAAICAAPVIFGHLGLFAGEAACCYPGMEKELAGAKVTDAPVSAENGIITSRGMGTAMDFGLAIVSHFKGEEAAGELARQIVYNR